MYMLNGIDLLWKKTGRWSPPGNRPLMAWTPPNHTADYIR